ncbi:MAG TPA: hypothetical protein VGD64_02100 [Acidisarcina sp.]
MRKVCLFGVLLLTAFALAGHDAGAADVKPLPNVEELRGRAVAGAEKQKADREKYMCRELDTNSDVDSKGVVKKTETAEREIFFVRGHQIAQTVLKDGKPLSESEQKKQDTEVKKRIEEASKDEKASQKRGEVTIGPDTFLRLSKLTNERRTMVAGRPTIVFDAAGDESKKADTLPERFIQAMAGTIAIDEETGQLQDVEMHGTKDVKVGGGLLANVHKGFMLHVVSKPRPDGVWLMDWAYGSGDARVGLFLHPAGRFQQQMEGCRVFDVNTSSTTALARP